MSNILEAPVSSPFGSFPRTFTLSSDYGQEGIPYSCLIAQSSGESLPSSICSEQYGVGQDDVIKNCIVNRYGLQKLNPLWFFPANTSLNEINSIAKALETIGPPIKASTDADTESRARRENTLWSTCAPTNQNLTVTNVDSFVNLRSKAGFNSSIVAEIPLGNGVTFSSEITANTNASGWNCRALCVGARDGKLSDGQQGELKSCFENNAIWYRVRASNGKTGWISGKFLDVVN